MMRKFNTNFDRRAIGDLLPRFLSATKREKDRRLHDDLQRDLLSDLNRAQPELETVTRLARWCKTRGIYADAMPVAKEISRLLFGEVLDREVLGV